MNNYKASSKILFSIVVAVIVVSWSLSAAITDVNIQKAMALAATTTNTAFGLQSPLYTEYDKPTNQKAVVVNGIHASSLSFCGSSLFPCLHHDLSPHTSLRNGLTTLLYS